MVGACVTGCVVGTMEMVVTTGTAGVGTGVVNAGAGAGGAGAAGFVHPAEKMTAVIRKIRIVPGLIFIPVNLTVFDINRFAVFHILKDSLLPSFTRTSLSPVKATREETGSFLQGHRFPTGVNQVQPDTNRDQECHDIVQEHISFVIGSLEHQHDKQVIEHYGNQHPGNSHTRVVPEGQGAPSS